MTHDIVLASAQTIALDGETWTMRGRIGSQKILVQRENGTSRVMTVAEVTDALGNGSCLSTTSPLPTLTRDLADISEREWEIANQRLTIVLGLQKIPNRTRADVEAAGRIAKVDASTIYDWINAFESRGFVTDLVPSKPGPKKGLKRLTPDIEKIITSQIDAVFLNKAPIQISRVVKEIAIACRKAGVTAPAPNTIRARIRNLDPEEVLIRQGRKERARNKFRVLRGTFPSEGTAMAVIQMDHTPANVEVVDEVFRRTIGRPWITLAIDVHTRVVCGIYISMDEPSVLAVAMCMINIVTKKDAYLAELDVPGSWPVYGKPGRIYVDNGKDFKSKAFARACVEHEIGLEHRPGGRPNWGGHIERLMKTTSDQVNSLPGTTFSNPKQRAETDSGANASMTLREFEAYMVDWVVNQYNCGLHTQIDMSPLYAFRKSVIGDNQMPGTGLREIDNERKFKLDFLPYAERTVSRHGVLLDYVFYWDEVLKSRVNENHYIIEGNARARAASKKYIFRFDPRDMSVLYYWDPDTRTHYEIHYRDLSRPAVSRFEIRRAKDLRREEGHANISEDDLFKTIERLRERTEAAAGKTKEARKDAARIANTKALVEKRRQSDQDNGSRARSDDDATDFSTVMPAADDPFDQPIEPFAVSGGLRDGIARRGDR